jgi:GYF domain 2
VSSSSCFDFIRFCIGNARRSKLQSIQNWYFLDNADQNKPKGPISRRDLDVMIKTNVLDSDSYVFQQGFSGWTQIRDVRELCTKLMGRS